MSHQSLRYVLLGFLLFRAVVSGANASVLQGAAVKAGIGSDHSYTAIGKLLNETGSWCSGVLISRTQILTAAHCLFNRRANRYFAAGALHFVSGYHLGGYAAHLRISDYRVAKGFDPHRYADTVDGDWAILNIDGQAPLSIFPIPLVRNLKSAEVKAIIVGYSQSRPYAQTIFPNCEVQTDLAVGGSLIFSSCRAEKGMSGAPILIDVGGELRLAGIQVASVQADATQGMIAVSVLEIGHFSVASGAEVLEVGPSCKLDAIATIKFGSTSGYSAGLSLTGSR